MHKFVSIISLLIVASAAATESPKTTGVISYNFQVRPILANNCFRCHGPDEKARKGELRLDLAEAAIAKGAWKAGSPADSEAVKRLFSTDEEEVMPPPEAHAEMTKEDRELLKTWVAQGANYERHWAFVPPVSPEVPVFRAPDPSSASPKGQAAKPVKPAQPVKSAKSAKPAKKAADPVVAPAGREFPAHFPIRQPIDAFVLDKLMQAKVNPAVEANPEQLLRRMTLDLTGLPPTLEDIRTCLADKSATRWETVVDRLLASRAFGERMATDWLDAARYADSYGRHEDADSPVWPYRDWLVRAYNQNLPFDQFLLWQTAGDRDDL
jgi:Protein of unknown function (DUF1549)/Planctomycete cytochrome C